MAKKIITAAGVVFIIFSVCFIFRSNYGAEETIVSAFTQADFVDMESSVETVADYGNTYLNDKDKKEFMNNLAEQIGLKGDFDYNVQRNTKGETVTISKTAKSASTVIKFISIENEVEENVIELEQYIIVNIKFNNGIEHVNSYKTLLENIFKEKGLEAKTTLSLTGSYSGRLQEEEKDEIVGGLLGKINAKTVTNEKTEDIYNIYAYSNLIDGYITVEKKKVNVNIAVNYDETNNLTNVLLSSPIINVDY